MDPVTPTEPSAANHPAALQAPPWLRSLVATIEDSTELDRWTRSFARVARVFTDSGAGPALRGEWLGHALHPALTDLPLGCWLGAGLLDVVGGRRSRPAAQRLVGLGVLAVPVTAASGWVDWSELDRPAKRVGIVHAAGNAFGALCYLQSWRQRRRGHHARGVAWALVGGGAAASAGYLGGHLALARGAGSGERGLGIRTDRLGRGEPDIDLRDPAWFDSVLDLVGAARVLGVEPNRIEIMVQEGVLVPLDGEGPLRFRAVEVDAVRVQRI
jgi:hypothetical protein